MVDTTTTSSDLSVPAPTAAPVPAPKADKPAAPSKPKWTPKVKENGVASGEGESSKGKSAKELKKEKRAALVAARGGSLVGAGDEAGGSTSAPTKAPGSVPLGSPAIPSTSSSTSIPTFPGPHHGAHPHAQTHPHAHSPHAQKGRPPILSSESALHLPPQQTLFYSHLPVARLPDSASASLNPKLHTSVLRLGMLMASGKLRGANARTMGLMQTFQEVIRDYTSPESAILWKDLPVHLSPMISWLETCRPKGVGGGNAIRWLKGEINRLSEVEAEYSEEEQKTYLIDAIQNYIRDRIEYADQVIADNAKEKIKPGDVVVTYARSSIVEKALLEAWRHIQSTSPNDTSLEVIVVDSRPLFEGKKLLENLMAAGISCSYTLLPLLSSALERANKVFIGASALHSDGALYSRAGTSLVALMAKEYRVPVVACVETYKFGERVALDGVATNELGEGDSILDGPWLRTGGDEDDEEMDEEEGQEGKKERGGGDLTPLVLMYDLTPPSLITAVCTEIGFIPPSSVPTVLGKGSGI